VIGHGLIERLVMLLLFAPLVVLAAILVIGLLCGRIGARGLWRDSFAAGDFSPARVYQTIAALTGAAGILATLWQSGATSFPPVADWLVASVGGGNIMYLGAKYMASRQTTGQQAPSMTGESDGERHDHP
jgi:hypothetical protein